MRIGDARQVDGAARLARCDVRRDRGLEEAGIHERVGMAVARFGLQEERILVRRSFRARDNAGCDRLHAGDADARFAKATQERCRHERLADARIGAGDEKTPPQIRPLHSRGVNRKRQTWPPRAMHSFSSTLAAAETGQQREIELADLGILHGELVEDAIVRLDRGCAAQVRPRAGVVAELVHDFGQLLYFLPSSGSRSPGARCCELRHDPPQRSFPSRSRRPVLPCSRAMASIQELREPGSSGGECPLCPGPSARTTSAVVRRSAARRIRRPGRRASGGRGAGAPQSASRARRARARRVLAPDLCLNKWRSSCLRVSPNGSLCGLQRRAWGSPGDLWHISILLMPLSSYTGSRQEIETLEEIEDEDSNPSLLLAAAACGWASGRGHCRNAPDTRPSYAKLADTRAALRDLWIGHVFWVRNVVEARFDNNGPLRLLRPSTR